MRRQEEALEARSRRRTRHGVDAVCRRLPDKNRSVSRSKTAFQLGFDVVALNVVIGADQLGAKNRIPEPPQYSLAHPDLQPLTPRNRRLKILTRLTANLTDGAESHRLATGRGLFFEIQYAPCIRDENSLRNTIANCQTLMHAGKGKGIIITSGAWMPQELRGPNDAANLGFLFGLSECTTREAVFGNCKGVIKHSETRRKVDRSIIFSKTVAELPEKDKWLVDACKAPGVEEVARKPSGSGDSQKQEGPPPKKKKKKGNC
ncbi:hypothetical protein MTO96_047527 [Rhipicephalus appendiculatus]